MEFQGNPFPNTLFPVLPSWLRILPHSSGSLIASRSRSVPEEIKANGESLPENNPPPVVFLKRALEFHDTKHVV